MYAILQLLIFKTNHLVKKTGRLEGNNVKCENF